MQNTSLKILMLFFLLSLLLRAKSENPQKIILAENGNSNYSIIVCPNADTNDRLAAEKLQEYFFRASGRKLSIRETTTLNMPGIYLASKGRTKGFSFPVSFDRLDKDGYLIETRNNNLLICGGSEKGLLYGVAHFLEKYLGCRKFSDREDFVPVLKVIALNPIRETQLPAFGYRSNSIKDRSYTDWHGLDTHDEVWGMFVHTFDRLIPPAEYFNSHPEYFSLLPAGRVPDAQLCLSNPDVLKIIIEKLTERMAQQPAKRYWSVSQNDTYSPCGCESCTKLDAMYGGPSGTMVWFCNQVARAFPDKQISTLAYQYTRTAPKKYCS